MDHQLPRSMPSSQSSLHIALSAHYSLCTLLSLHIALSAHRTLCTSHSLHFPLPHSNSLPALKLRQHPLNHPTQSICSFVRVNPSQQLRQVRQSKPRACRRRHPRKRNMTPEPQSLRSRRLLRRRVRRIEGEAKRKWKTYQAKRRLRKPRERLRRQMTQIPLLMPRTRLKQKLDPARHRPNWQDPMRKTPKHPEYGIQERQGKEPRKEQPDPKLIQEGKEKEKVKRKQEQAPNQQDPGHYQPVHPVPATSNFPSKRTPHNSILFALTPLAFRNGVDMRYLLLANRFGRSKTIGLH